jgi:hypothetical protein
VNAQKHAEVNSQENCRAGECTKTC